MCEILSDNFNTSYSRFGKILCTSTVVPATILRGLFPQLTDILAYFHFPQPTKPQRKNT